MLVVFSWCVLLVIRLVSLFSVIRVMLLKWLFYGCIIIWYSGVSVCCGLFVVVSVRFRLWKFCGFFWFIVSICLNIGIVSVGVLVCISW